MVMTIFRSRLREAHRVEYEAMAARMEALAREQPGFRAFKTFVAEDGERVSLVEFETLEDVDAWRRHPEHVEAQRLGRERFYASFSILTCEPLRHASFEA